MSFIDYVFIPLIFIVVLIYFVSPIKYRWIVLLLASILFFCTWGVNMLPLAIGATIVAWIVSNVIEKWNVNFDVEVKNNDSYDQSEKNVLQKKLKTRCKYVLWIGVVLVLSVLLFSKVESVFILGVSYYTMSLIGYMADVYWKKEKAEKNLFKLMLFTLYFPKILQGPISKHKNIKASLYEGTSFEYKRFCYGLQRVLWGYFKKLVIADRLLLFIQPAFVNYENYHGSILLVAAVFSALQMYCDFSGCMDIALGVSEIFGIKLEENFKRPFFAKSVPEFWTRWHISLSTWFKDYIYMPIVISPKIIKISGKLKKAFGKRVAKNFVTIVPVMTVWTITGLWHGTGWNYVAWGVYWAILFILSTILDPEIKKITKVLHINTETKDFQLFRQIRTIALFVICRVIVYPADLNVSKEVFEKIFFNFGPWQLLDGTLYTVGLDQAGFMLVVFALLLMYVISKKQEQGIKIRDEIASLSIVGRWIVYLAGIVGVLIFGIYGPGFDAASFVYMNF